MAGTLAAQLCFSSTSAGVINIHKAAYATSSPKHPMPCSRLCVVTGTRGLVAFSTGGGTPTPPGISEKLSESIKDAEEACSGGAGENGASAGECAAAWDVVEELSAAAGHTREKLKASSDPLENYCKDNPETDECRTYDN